MQNITRASIQKQLLTITLIFLSLMIFQGIINPVYSQIKTAQMNSFQIILNNALFKKSGVYKLDINAKGVDFAQGKIASLSIVCLGFKNKKILIDRLTLALRNVDFSPEKLFADQDLILSHPVDAIASVTLTEDGLNSILNRPKTLEKLANVTTVKIKKLGIVINSGLISFTNPQANILPNDTIRINMMASLGNMISFPVSFSTRLVIDNNKLTLVSPTLSTSGIALPPDVSQILNSKLNSIILHEEEKLKEDAEIIVTAIESIPGKALTLRAKTTIKKLEFSKKDKDD